MVADESWWVTGKGPADRCELGPSDGGGRGEKCGVASRHTTQADPGKDMRAWVGLTVTNL